MNRRQTPLPYLIAAVGGGLLFVSLFFNWLSGTSIRIALNRTFDSSQTGWEIFSGVDIFLAVLGIATIAWCAMEFLGFAPPPWLRGFVRWGGLAGLAIVLAYILENDNAGFGAFVGFLGAASMLAGGILLVRPDLAERVEAAAGGVSRGAPGGAPAGTAAVPGAARPAAAPPPPAAAAPAARPAPAVPVQPVHPTAPVPPQPAQPPPAPAAAPPMPPQPAMPPEPPAAHPGPPAGWYPDPQGLARLRYWDGAAWTDQTSA